MTLYRGLLALILIGFLAGCTVQDTLGSSSTASPSAVVGEHEGHHHTAPHGGALVVLGQEFAHLEFVLQPDSGTLTVYVLDGEAEKALRLPGGKLELELKQGEKLVLEPVADELTGATLSDTSTFRAQSDSLKGLESFEAVLVSVDIKGQSFKNVAFAYPDGNETDDHEHDHGHDSL